MKNQVIIKSSKHGLLVRLDEKVPYEELLSQIEEKFKSSAKFFGKAKMAISFEGRVLTMNQEKEIIDLITQITEIEFVCIIDHNEKTESTYKSIVEESLDAITKQDGKFYRGTLRKRQVLETESSIVILGDVDYGALVVSKGNIVVLGTVRGVVHAGAAGDREAFVVALSLTPKQLKIADLTASRHVLVLNETTSREPKIAAIEGDRIYVDPLID